MGGNTNPDDNLQLRLSLAAPCCSGGPGGPRIVTNRMLDMPKSGVPCNAAPPSLFSVLQVATDNDADGLHKIPAVNRNADIDLSGNSPLISPVLSLELQIGQANGVSVATNSGYNQRQQPVQSTPDKQLLPISISCTTAVLTAPRKDQMGKRSNTGSDDGLMNVASNHDNAISVMTVVHMSANNIPQDMGSIADHWPYSGTIKPKRYRNASEEHHYLRHAPIDVRDILKIRGAHHKITTPPALYDLHAGGVHNGLSFHTSVPSSRGRPLTNQLLVSKELVPVCSICQYNIEAVADAVLGINGMSGNVTELPMNHKTIRCNPIVNSRMPLSIRKDQQLCYNQQYLHDETSVEQCGYPAADIRHHQHEVGRCQCCLRHDQYEVGRCQCCLRRQLANMAHTGGGTTTSSINHTALSGFMNQVVGPAPTGRTYMLFHTPSIHEKLLVDYLIAKKQNKTHPLDKVVVKANAYEKHPWHYAWGAVNDQEALYFCCITKYSRRGNMMTRDRMSREGGRWKQQGMVQPMLQHGSSSSTSNYATTRVAAGNGRAVVAVKASKTYLSYIPRGSYSKLAARCGHIELFLRGDQDSYLAHRHHYATQHEYQGQALSPAGNMTKYSGYRVKHRHRMIEIALDADLHAEKESLKLKLIPRPFLVMCIMRKSC